MIEKVTCGHQCMDKQTARKKMYGQPDCVMNLATFLENNDI